MSSFFRVDHRHSRAQFGDYDDFATVLIEYVVGVACRCEICVFYLPARIDQFAVKGSDRIDCLSVCSLLQDSSLLVAGSRIVIYILYLVSTMMLGFHILGVRTVEAAAYCHMPVTLWQRHSACSTSQFLALLLLGDLGRILISVELWGFLLALKKFQSECLKDA